MAGIADFFNNFGAPADDGYMTPAQRAQAQQHGLLALAGPLLEAAQPSTVRRGIGSAFGKGIAGMMQAQSQAQRDALQSQMFGMQKRRFEQELADAPLRQRGLELGNQAAEAKLSEGQRKQDYVEQAARTLGGTPALPDAGQFGVPFTDAEGQATPQPATGDPQTAALIRMGGENIADELLKARLGIGDASGASLGAPTWGTRQDGTPVLLQVTRSGEARELKLPAGVTPAKTKPLDLGTAWGIQGPDGRIVSVIPKDVAGVKREQELGTAAGERDTGLPKARAALGTLERNSTIVTNTIDKAIAASEKFGATGYPYWLTPKGMPGAANELDNYLDTIKSRIGFNELQEMRANSPTGGALGNVSDRETALLTAVQGALDPRQHKQLTENLKTIRDIYPQVLAERRQAFDYDYPGGKPRSAGAPPAPPTAPAAAPPRAVLNGRSITVRGGQWMYEDTGEPAQ